MRNKTPSTAFTFCLAIAFCQLGSVLLRAQESSLTWTSSTGTTIEADFVRLTDDGVILKLLSDGRQAEVPFSKLSLESHLQAIRLGKPEEFSKPLVKAEVKPAIEIPPLREINVDAILVSPFSNSQSLQELIDTTSQELDNGNLFVLWHLLPEQMQADIETLIVKAMVKVGNGPVLQVRTLMNDLNTIATEKEEFLFANPILAENGEAAEELKAKWPAIRQFIGSIAKEELWQADNFQQGKVERWLASLLAAIGSNQDALKAVAETDMPGVASPKLTDIVQVVASSADQGQIQFSNPAIPLPSDEKLTVRKIDGRWVIPKAMNSLRTALDDALENVDKMDAASVRTSIQSAMTTVIPPVGALARAGTQEEFDAVIASLEPLMKGIAASIPAELPAAMATASEAEADNSRGRGGPGDTRGGRSGGSGRRRGGPGIGGN